MKLRLTAQHAIRAFPAQRPGTTSSTGRKSDRVRAGTGLGLAISRARGFVDAMNGTITATNRTDRTGAAFTIRLPIPVQPRQLETAA